MTLRDTFYASSTFILFHSFIFYRLKHTDIDLNTNGILAKVYSNKHNQIIKRERNSLNLEKEKKRKKKRIIIANREKPSSSSFRFRFIPDSFILSLSLFIESLSLNPDNNPFSPTHGVRKKYYSHIVSHPTASELNINFFACCNDLVILIRMHGHTHIMSR